MALDKIFTCDIAELVSHLPSHFGFPYVSSESTPRPWVQGTYVDG